MITDFTFCYEDNKMMLDKDRGSSSTRELELAEKYLHMKTVETEYGTLVEKTILDRPYILCLPKEDKVYGILMFYHGSRDNALMCALDTTRWIEHSKNLIVVFGQAEGKEETPHIHPDYGGVSYGELYWEIHDTAPQFAKDLAYTESIITEIKKDYKIDKERIYFVGYSNGGVFGCLLAIYSSVFTKIVSYMGGIGWDSTFYLDFDQAKDRKTKLLFYTGEEDVHKIPCELAHNIFTSEGFSSTLYVEPKKNHDYHYSAEAYILKWLD